MRVEHIGDCTLYLADCRDVLPTLSKVDAVITDPPYGIAFKSGRTGAEIAGDADLSVRDEALAMLSGIPAAVFGAPHLAAPDGTKARLVWHRPGSGMGDLAMPWKPDYEMIFIVGGGFRHHTRGASVLSFSWDTFRGDALHPHQKPIALMAHLIERAPSGIVLDPFMGSGSTGVACVQLGRKFIGIEREPKYFHIACERISRAVAQGQLFDATAKPSAEQMGLV